MGKTKFWKLYEGNRVFRYIFKVLAVIILFLSFYIDMYSRKTLGILQIPISIIIFFIYIFLMAMVVNIRSDTTIMVVLRFLLEVIIGFVILGMIYLLVVNNILPYPM
ncbi:MAG: hypothetical protein MSA01_03315 [Anaeromassilibacillus sp.]|nr:hypothetical protein [Anaeromassilibacillus sp.]